MSYRITEACEACGTCKDACPNEAIIEGDIYKIDAEKCAECGACVEECPTGAIVEE